MNLDELKQRYQWHYRPQQPERPAWFTAWPGGNRVALTLIVLHEWESDPAPVRPMPAGAHHHLDFLALGAREYGARFGVWRILDVLRRHEVKASFVISGLVAELFPDTIRAIHAQGHEVATHGWDQSVHPPTFETKAEETASIRNAIGSLQRITGEPVLGYMSQGPRPTPNTLEMCAELGFIWTSDYADSDVPYLIDVNGTPIVSVGYAPPGYVDYTLAQYGPTEGLQLMVDEFDAVYEESAQHPMKYCYPLHVHVGGRPGMAKLLDDFLTYVKSHEGVWICRAIDMARFWREQSGLPA